MSVCRLHIVDRDIQGVPKNPPNNSEFKNRTELNLKSDAVYSHLGLKIAVMITFKIFEVCLLLCIIYLYISLCLYDIEHSFVFRKPTSYRVVILITIRDTLMTTQSGFCQSFLTRFVL